MNGREILELVFGLCVIIISIISFVAVAKDFFKDKDDYTNCEVQEKTMEQEKTKKTDSRKFVVWIVWLIITILVIAWCALVMIITKQIQEQLVGLVEKALSYFFAISMMYLGVNVGQKVGLAFADKLMPKEESNIETEENEK